jgi:hypothetical protein
MMYECYSNAEMQWSNKDRAKWKALGDAISKAVEEVKTLTGNGNGNGDQNVNHS